MGDRDYTQSQVLKFLADISNTAEDANNEVLEILKSKLTYVDYKSVEFLLERTERHYNILYEFIIKGEL